MKTNVHILKEVKQALEDSDSICLQQVIYDYGGSTGDPCFRFIRRDDKGRLKPQRGQAAIPSLEILKNLIIKMHKESLKFNIKEPRV